jgi:peptidoglycan/LPS O-acetylase OafA/YrhL
VDLFFVLSGFLITGILLDSKDSPRYFRNFYMRRFLRIFPLYYGWLIFIFVLLPLCFPGRSSLQCPLRSQLPFWLYYSNLVDWFPALQMGKEVSLGHFWSLAIEEQFYLIWPLLLFFLDRRGVIAASIFIIVLALLTRVCLLSTGHPAQVYGFTLSRFDAIAMGALLAAALRSPRLFEIVHAATPGTLLIAAFVVAILIAVPRRSEIAPLVVVKYTAFAILFGSLLVYVLLREESLLGVACRSPVLRFFGKYSYGLYIFHGALGPWITHLAPRQPLIAVLHSDLAAMFVRMAILLAISTLAAFASYHLYEKHFLHLKRFFEYRSPPPVSGVPLQAAQEHHAALAAELR